jgi:hypothetical protein
VTNSDITPDNIGQNICLKGWSIRPGLTVSVLLTFCMCPHTLMQNICRRVGSRQRLIYYKGRSTF